MDEFVPLAVDDDELVEELLVLTTAEEDEGDAPPLAVTVVVEAEAVTVIAEVTVLPAPVVVTVVVLPGLAYKAYPATAMAIMTMMTAAIMIVEAPFLLSVLMALCSPLHNAI